MIRSRLQLVAFSLAFTGLLLVANSLVAGLAACHTGEICP